MRRLILLEPEDEVLDVARDGRLHWRVDSTLRGLAQRRSDGERADLHALPYRAESLYHLHEQPAHDERVCLAVVLCVQPHLSGRIEAHDAADRHEQPRAPPQLLGDHHVEARAQRRRHRQGLAEDRAPRRLWHRANMLRLHRQETRRRRVDRAIPLEDSSNKPWRACAGG